MLNAAKALNSQKAGISTAMMMRMAWEGLMKAKKLLLKQLLMDMAGKRSIYNF
jgi:cytochrome c oxidase subunit IV